MHNTSGRYAQFMRRQCTNVAEVAEKIPALTVRSTGSAPPEWWLPHAGHPAPERRNIQFNLITGVYKPTEGSFYLNGQRMNGKKTHQIVHAGIARTFQNIRLFKKMTVLENVKAAMLEELPYSMPQAIFRTKAYWAQEQAATERAKRANPRILSPSLHFSLICSLFQVL